MTEPCPIDCPWIDPSRRGVSEPRADRRRFLRLILSLFMLSAPVRAWARTVAIRLGTLAELQPIGGSVVVKVGTHKLLLIRESQTNVLAFSAICTHKKTTVGYDPSSRMIRCPKHKSVFDLGGRNVDGPAPRPLPKYPSRLLGDGRILIKLDS